MTCSGHCPLPHAGTFNCLGSNWLGAGGKGGGLSGAGDGQQGRGQGRGLTHKMAMSRNLVLACTKQPLGHMYALGDLSSSSSSIIMLCDWWGQCHTYE